MLSFRGHGTMARLEETLFMLWLEYEDIIYEICLVGKIIVFHNFSVVLFWKFHTFTPSTCMLKWRIWIPFHLMALFVQRIIDYRVLPRLYIVSGKVEVHLYRWLKSLKLYWMLNIIFIVSTILCRREEASLMEFM